jgi:hypothetical protein
MEDTALKSIAEAVLQAGGGAAILVMVGKWFLAKVQENAKKLEALKEEQFKETVSELKAVGKEIRIEVAALKERIHHVEKLWIEGIAKMTANAEKFASLSKAFEGFVKTTGERLKVVESNSDDVIRIGKAMAVRIKGSKSGGEE